MSDATRIPLGHTTTGHVTMDHDPERSPLRSMLDRFDKAVEVLGLDLGMVSYLKTPHRQVVISVPIHLDDGTLEVYTGYRIIHNNRGHARLLDTPLASVENRPQATTD